MNRNNLALLNTLGLLGMTAVLLIETSFVARDTWYARLR